MQRFRTRDGAARFGVEGPGKERESRDGLESAHAKEGREGENDADERWPSRGLAGVLYLCGRV